MSRVRPSQGPMIAPLSALGLVAISLSAGPAPAGAQSLQTCAAIAADAERLACYDRVAGRGVPGAAASAAKSAPAATAPAATAPAAGAAAPASAQPAARQAAPAPPAAATFGNYAAEHPKPTVTADASLEARVAALGNSANGHMTVLLEGGALWELEDADPLLAVGETVTIKRATFGSFILRTPSHRDHRARRLR